MSTPALYIVQDAHAFWLAPTVDIFGDPDVELWGCTTSAGGTLDNANAYPVDHPGDFGAARTAQIADALRALADNGPVA